VSLTPAPFQQVGKRTELFARLSVVIATV